MFMNSKKQYFRLTSESFHSEKENIYTKPTRRNNQFLLDENKSKMKKIVELLDQEMEKPTFYYNIIDKFLQENLNSRNRELCFNVLKFYTMKFLKYRSFRNSKKFFSHFMILVDLSKNRQEVLEFLLQHKIGAKNIELYDKLGIILHLKGERLLEERLYYLGIQNQADEIQLKNRILELQDLAKEDHNTGKLSDIQFKSTSSLFIKDHQLKLKRNINIKKTQLIKKKIELKDIHPKDFKGINTRGVKFLDLQDYSRVLNKRKSQSATKHKENLDIYDILKVVDENNCPNNQDKDKEKNETVKVKLQTNRKLDFNHLEKAKDFKILENQTFDLENTKLFYKNELKPSFTLMRSDSNKENFFKKPRRHSSNPRKALQELRAERK